MTNKAVTYPDSDSSIARIFSLLNQPIRKQVLAILHESGPISFKSLTERLGIERAALAYHLRILRRAGLCENFYDRLEDSQAHSFYRLTAFSKWLISHDLKLTMESQLFRTPASDRILDELELPHDDESNLGIRIRYDEPKDIKPGIERPAQVLADISTRSLAKYEEDVKVRSDPRVRNYNYRIKVRL